MNFLNIDKSARRKEHFARGGSPSSWMKRSKCLQNNKSKAVKNKKACRRKVTCR